MNDIHSCNVALIQHHGQLPARAARAGQLGRCPRCWTWATEPGIPRLWALIQIRWNTNKLLLIIWRALDLALSWWETMIFIYCRVYSEQFFWKHCFLTTQWVMPGCKIITFQFNRPSFCPLKDKGREYFVLALNVLTWQHTRHLRTRTTKLNKQR